jgi:hypothetical protein
VKIIHIAVVGVVAVSTGTAAQVSQVSYGSLTGTQFVTFDDVAGGAVSGTNYDGVLFSNSVGFAERFVGQTLTAAGNFDVLGGAPSGALVLQVGAAGRNLDVVAIRSTQKLTGLGPRGFPDFNAIGEGAIAALFSTDQSQFGFQLSGGEHGAAHIDFFRVDGSLIQSIALGGLANRYFGFLRDGGLQDIRGFSIWNNDVGGIGFDNLKFDVRSTVGVVPEPESWALLIGGFGLVGAVMRRRRRILAIAG